MGRGWAGKLFLLLAQGVARANEIRVLAQFLDVLRGQIARGAQQSALLLGEPLTVRRQEHRDRTAERAGQSVQVRHTRLVDSTFPTGNRVRSDTKLPRQSSHVGLGGGYLLGDATRRTGCVTLSTKTNDSRRLADRAGH